MKQDTNFDQLGPRFQRNIYDGAKGNIRLAVLERDFHELLEQNQLKRDRAGSELNLKGMSVLDAGAGQGHFALTLAKTGARLTLCDISSEMLAVAERKFKDAKISEEKYVIENCALQEIAAKQSGPYDLILCHAVAEWLAQPEDVFSTLLPLLKADGYLSLIFYNFHGLEFKNLLRTNFKRFDRNNFKSYRGSLTPINPLTPESVLALANHYQLQLKIQSGIRVFHDYVLNKQDREREPEALLIKELEYSRIEPFWRLGRYIHFLFRKCR